MEKNIVKTWCACAAILLMMFSAGSVCAEPPSPEEMANLGEEIFFDKISDPDSMACAECHGPDVGWTGPNPGVNKDGTVYPGAVPQRFGNRKPPSSGYATLSPVFYYDGENFVGGNFWDGRATGWLLGNPAADQALGPFTNPLEQNNADEFAVIDQICTAKYADQFIRLFRQYEGGKIDPCGTTDEDEIKTVYQFVGLAIAAYEDSTAVNAYSSKFDTFLAGDVELTDQELAGYQLFIGKAQCSACHPIDGDLPVLTDFTYDNLGLPRNPENPFYDMDEVYFDDGTPINPEGEGWIDPGLGGFLETLIGNGDTPLSVSVDQALVDENMGKHKVPTLRNVAKAPSENFQKAYGHNGYFKSLEGIVHFYNTRDIKDPCEDPWFTEEEALAADCWPEPEVSKNVNKGELGSLGLSTEEEAALVAFMKTLSDGYDPEKDKKK